MDNYIAVYLFDIKRAIDDGGKFFCRLPDAV